MSKGWLASKYELYSTVMTILEHLRVIVRMVYLSCLARITYYMCAICDNTVYIFFSSRKTKQNIPSKQ